MALTFGGKTEPQNAQKKRRDDEAAHDEYRQTGFEPGVTHTRRRDGSARGRQQDDRSWTDINRPAFNETQVWIQCRQGLGHVAAPGVLAQQRSAEHTVPKNPVMKAEMPVVWLETLQQRMRGHHPRLVQDGCSNSADRAAAEIPQPPTSRPICDDAHCGQCQRGDQQRQTQRSRAPRTGFPAFSYGAPPGSAAVDSQHLDHRVQRLVHRNVSKGFHALNDLPSAAPPDRCPDNAADFASDRATVGGGIPNAGPAYGFCKWKYHYAAISAVRCTGWDGLDVPSKGVLGCSDA